MKKIKVKLSKEGIAELKRELIKYKEDLVLKTQLLVETLANRGYDVVLAKINEYNIIETGTLKGSLRTEINGTKAVIKIGDCAMFVEFGTGVVGEKKGYIGNSNGWQYNIGEKIKEYNIGGVPTVGWFYYDNGKFRFTSGMESRPFMYESAQELRYVELEKIVKEIFQ